MRGFVLLSTTFLIAIIALIVLTLASSLNLDSKTLNQLALRQKRLAEIEENAHAIIAEVSSEQLVDCYTDKGRESINYEFVKKNGCSFVNHKFLLKNLGEFVCVVINNSQSLLATQHYNLYLINQELNNHLLQVHFVTAGKRSECLQAQQRLVTPGIISWLLNES